VRLTLDLCELSGNRRRGLDALRNAGGCLSVKRICAPAFVAQEDIGDPIALR